MKEKCWMCLEDLENCKCKKKQEVSESELSDLLCAINELDEEIRIKSIKLLSMRNDWLRGKGWEITEEDIGTRSYFYQKFGELFICERAAIDRELHGA